MPNYSYFCENCELNFELFFYIRDYIDKPKCPNCKNNKKTSRDYISDVATQASSVKKSDSELKTIGDLALRNRDRLSDDEKQSLHAKHNSYKDNKIETKPLPKGMTYTQKPKTKHKWT
jgi:putative FmdB family regulatory protein